MTNTYDTDIVAWSIEQGQALRDRSANQLDWDNIAEEIESVGRSETNAVRSLLTNAIEHKLRILAWPDHTAANHWRAEVRVWLAQVADDHRTSMHIDLSNTFRLARLKLDVYILDIGEPTVPLPLECPWSLDALIAEGEAARQRHLGE